MNQVTPRCKRHNGPRAVAVSMNSVLTTAKIFAVSGISAVFFALILRSLA